jgi:deoxyribodipyrimidine photo-lyase
MSRSVMWFRRDLRLGDHPALTQAAANGEVAGLFVVDPALYDSAGAVRQRALLTALHSLDSDMGGSLALRHGDPVRCVVDVAHKVGAESVFASADYSPAGKQRDAAVHSALAANGISLRLVGSPYAVSPGKVTKADGTSYAVFTPFSKAWRSAGWPEPLPVPSVHWIDPNDVGCDGYPPEPNGPVVTGRALPLGERAALVRLDEFLSTNVKNYDNMRDAPAADYTSRLSGALKYGCIHPRTILARLGQSKGEHIFANELCWRDFYADVLHRRPDTNWHNLSTSMDAMRLDTDDRAKRRFDQWCQGQTGYPIVDAGMRQLLAEGFMHNRVRMIVASFLVKDLHLPWQWGARHFLQHLIDGDVASNNHGWQWAAGTGTDAAPYFRIFNPMTQSEKFDPTGDYLVRYVPELSRLQGSKFIHAPWTSPSPPADYPAPMVDHAEERNEALARYSALRSTRTASSTPLA